MKNVVFVSSVLAVAGVASALPFEALSYEAGGGLPGIVAGGFTVNQGGFFASDGIGSGIQSGSAGGFNAGNEAEFDSYFTLDSFGPTARNRSSGAANNSTTTLNFYGNYGPAGAAAADYNQGETIAGYAFIAGPGSHIGLDGGALENAARAGVAVAPPPVVSGFAPTATGGRSNLDGVFVGRFTIQSGATLSGDIFFSIRTIGAPQGTPAFGQNLVLGGSSASFEISVGVFQDLALRAYRVATVDLENPSAATQDGIDNGTPFGSADVYDLWVQVIPAPGAVALAGLAGLVSARRRRA